MSPARILHPDLTTDQRQRLFEEGVRCFNGADFFDAHEYWEEIWRSRDVDRKDFYQGLIQVAVGFFHYRSQQRPDVARRVLAKGRRRLALFAPRCAGIDVDRFLGAVREWEQFLDAGLEREPALPRLEVREAAWHERNSE